MIIGNKYNPELFKNLYEKHILNNINLYVEPFGGSFGLFKLIKDRIDISIYNDIDLNTYNTYNNIANESYNLDYKDIINKFDSIDTFFYLDPPYYNKYYYDYNFDENQHIELYNIINNLKGKFILSYNYCDFIINLYNKYNIERYNGKNLYHKNELIITSHAK